MNLEQIEAWVLGVLQHNRLSNGEYVLSEAELLSIVDVAYKAGRIDGGGKVFREMKQGLAGINIRIVE